MYQRTVLALLAGMLLALPAQAGFKEGALAYRDGDFAKAVKEFEPLAEQGDASAQYMAGSAYAVAKPPLQDFAKAEKWLRGHLLAEVTQHAMQDQFSAADIAAGAARAREWRCKS